MFFKCYFFKYKTSVQIYAHDFSNKILKNSFFSASSTRYNSLSYVSTKGTLRNFLLLIVARNKRLMSTSRNSCHLSSSHKLISEEHFSFVSIIETIVCFRNLLYPLDQQVLNTQCRDEIRELVATTVSDYIILSRKKKKRRKHKLWMRSSLKERKCGLRLNSRLRLMDSLRKDNLLTGHIIIRRIQNFIRISSFNLE